MSSGEVPSAFLDASALYPSLLRNILMWLAEKDLFRPHWSAQVQDEWTRSVLRDRPDLSPAQVERTRRLMEEHAEAALVSGYAHLIETISLPDADDRHVLAAALHCEAQILVTANLRDFPEVVLSPRGVEAQHPDAFILCLFNASPEGVIDSLRELRGSLKNPPMTAAALLAEMDRQGLRETAQALSAFADSF